jgi:hypothetical protein
MKTNIHFNLSRAVLLRMRNNSDRSCRDNQNTHFVSKNFSSTIVPFMRYVGKYCRAGQAIDDNMAHAHCKLDA